jgi:hypothetical protein
MPDPIAAPAQLSNQGRVFFTRTAAHFAQKRASAPI